MSELFFFISSTPGGGLSYTGSGTMVISGQTESAIHYPTAKGILVKQSGLSLRIYEPLCDSSGASVTSGTTSLRIFELQSDGSLKQFDFADATFKTTALTSATATMTNQAGSESSTGIWSYVQHNISGFTSGNIYIYSVSNTNATPPTVESEFQYGSMEGDLLVTSGGTGVGYLKTDVTEISANADAATMLMTMLVGFESGTARGSGAASITLRAAASATTDIYKDQIVYLTSGDGAQQTNHVTAYDGSTQTATVETPWVTAPKSGTTYVILGRLSPHPSMSFAAHSTSTNTGNRVISYLKDFKGGWRTVTHFKDNTGKWKTV